MAASALSCRGLSRDGPRRGAVLPAERGEASRAQLARACSVSRLQGCEQDPELNGRPSEGCGSGRGVTRMDSRSRTRTLVATGGVGCGLATRLAWRLRAEVQVSLGHGLASGSPRAPRSRDCVKAEPIKAQQPPGGQGSSPSTCGSRRPPLLGARATLPAAHGPPGLGGGAGERTAEQGGHSQMALTRCEYTLVSFCHLLLSLKHYISICFHTSLPSPPPLLEAHSTNP